MKKLITSVCILLCLSLVIFPSSVLAITKTNTLKEGIYTVSNLNLDLNKIYAVENLSDTEIALIVLTDDHSDLLQYIKLIPGSQKQNLLPMKPNYRLIIMTKSEVYLS